MINKKEQRTSTVFIRGISANTKDSVLSETFKKFGNIRQAFVTKPKANSTGNTIGYVKFTTIEEATSAIKAVQTIGNQKVILSYARKKPRKYREAVKENQHEKYGSGLSDTDEEEKVETKPAKSFEKTKSAKISLVDPVDDSTALKQETLVDYMSDFPRNEMTIYIQNLIEGLTENQLKKKCRKVGDVEKIILNGSNASVTYKEKSSVQQALKKLNNHVYKQQVITAVSSMLSSKAMKKHTTPSRIVIRNLSFKVTEELLQTELTSYGKILDLSVPKNGEGKIRGFAFVSYINKFEANKALQKLNGKEILGRKVAVDWALSKDQYDKKVSTKTEDGSINDDDGNNVGNETNDKNEGSTDEEDVPDSENENEKGESSDNEDEKDEAEEEFQPKREYDDVREGKTLFMGNLPFDAEKVDILDAFSIFGSIRYVRMVFDKEKDRPKGIAFLQFNEKSDADGCLKRSEQQPICIGGRTISLKRAVDSKELSLDKPAANVGKDNRNLHLAMEGVIKDGTNAATGVSKADMMKRKLALEAKKKKLKNINFFVSTDRLCVRNMPSTFGETDLKQLMTKYGRIVQVKIMRDIKQANSAGIGKSKGYGFVQFSKHEAALAALRATNNNPNVFTAQKRPIVDFSIENSGILNARAKKGPPSRDSRAAKPKKSFNARWKEKREQRKSEPKTKSVSEQSTVLANTGANDVKPAKKKGKKKRKAPSTNIPENKNKQATPENSTQFSLAVSESRPLKRGKNKSERPNKKQKRLKEKGEEAAFQKLVQNYKGKLESGDQQRTFKKWYDD